MSNTQKNFWWVGLAEELQNDIECEDC